MDFNIKHICSLLTILFNLIEAQDISSIPCPDIFKYAYIGNQWVGYISVDRIQPGETLLEAKFAIQTRLTSDYVGKVDVLSKFQKANEPATYVVMFPVQNPLPIVLDIRINGKSICSGPPPNAEYVTSIVLRNQQKFQCDDCEKNPVGSNTNNNCGMPAPQSAAFIFRGMTIDAGSWPWLVGILTRKDKIFKCGGTLVSSRTVITSAHCFKLHNEIYSENDIYMVFGRHNITNSNEGTVAYIRKIYMHPDWTGTGDSYDGDIALTILQKQVLFTRTIIPACLWPSSVDIPSIDPTVVGWGRDENGALSDVPKKIITKIVSDGTCLRSNPIFAQITSERTFCAGERNGQSPCAGDSGSGLLVEYNKKWYLRGIVSAGINDIRKGCDAYQYSVFVDVTKFDDFIRSNLVA